LSETDAPWLSPAPNRGKVNTPLNIVYVVEEIAKLLNKNVNELAEQLFNNAIEAFDISF
jgi:TatD DNase family protein